MPSLCDPSVHREVDAYIGHLLALMDEPEDAEDLDLAWEHEENKSRGPALPVVLGSQAPSL